MQSVEDKNNLNIQKPENKNKLDEICLEDNISENAVQKRIQNVCINY